ncbi:amino acid adenylation domain-containing protein [Micromonospora sp. NPDC049047]|uniref:non-ribosomal peptide synthetase/type I polyketide synthase n=1 Tax=Micromonospora sp. NPDC049047 TaxID=3155645 RepID=UPI0033DB1C14
MTDVTDERHQVLGRSVREIRRLRAELESARQAATEPIAIIGMACRMPSDVRDPEQFWQFLRSGGDGVRDVPDDRWDVDAFHDPTGRRPGTSYTRRGAFLDDVASFDAAFFGVSPREAPWLDPQQRLLLEVSWSAFEDAGQAPDRLAGTETGVYLGITNYDYCQVEMQQVAPAELEAHYATSNASTFAAGRISYWLGLNGPSLSVDTSCSSSLVGVHLAVQALRSGECSMALAGGVNVLLSPEVFVVLSKTGALAPDGVCKTFDKKANGYARGEGCGVIVLKRLSDALAAGDPIKAVIRGSAVNQDGRSSGPTVPNPKAQQDVIRRAVRSAGVEPSQIGYVEAHGTGTPLGDPIELRALSAVLGDRGAAGPLQVGSLKTNIGHLEPAAGIAGLMKVVLALRHAEIPPHLNLSEVNPEIDLDELGVTIPTEVTAWPAGPRPRVGGVSSFGASGTNAHVVIEEAPPVTVEPAGPDRGSHVLVLSAKTPAALAELTEAYTARLADAAPQELADLCHTAANGRARLPYRAAVSGSTPGEISRRLRDPRRVDGHVPSGTRPRVAFLFTGQGSQYAAMAAELSRTEPVFRASLDECDEILRPLLGRPLDELLADEELVHQTEYAQPLLFAVEYGLAQLWTSWGVRPSAVLGHSLGELVAACVAGVLPLADGLRLAVRRGAFMAELTEPGAMAAVFAAREVVDAALAPYADRLCVAAVNGPENFVVSGSGPALAELLTALAEQGVRTRPLNTGRAFHSPLMDPVLDRFEEEAATVGYAHPRLTLVSNVTGRPVEQIDAAYWRDHIRRPVEFAAGITALLDDGYDTFVEIGPAPTLLGLTRRMTMDRQVRLLPSLRPRHDDWAVLTESLAGLFVAGCDIDWASFDAGRGRRKVTLPTYPFQRTRYWFSRSATPAGTPPLGSGQPGTGLLGPRVPSPLDVAQFAGRLAIADHSCLGDCVMDGLPVVNIGVYLESAFAAVRQTGGGAGALVAEGTLVLQGLVLDHDTPTATQLLLERDGGYRYYAADGSSWVLHAQGRVRADETLASPADGEAYREDVRSGLGGELSGDDFYQRLWRRKLYLGPSARWIERIWHGGSEAIAQMRAPRDGEADAYLLHPGLVDAMFQVLFACLPAEAPADAAYALVGIDRFEFHGGAAGPLYCRATLLPETDPESTLVARVRLEDAAGRIVVDASGVLAKRAGRGAMLREGAHRPAAEPHRAAPVPARTGAAEFATAAPADRPAVLLSILRRSVAGALRAVPDDLDVHEPLSQLGLDSLMALEVKESLSAELGLALPLVAFLDGSSIAKLGDLVLPMLGEPVTTTDQPAPSAQLPALVADDEARYDAFPLTDLQQAYLVGRSDAFALGRISTYFYLEVDLTGTDLARIEDAWNAMIARHDMLRAVVTPEGWQRVLADVPTYRIAITDLAGADERTRTAHLAEVHDAMKYQVLDAGTWPMFDIRATVLAPDRIRLHLGMDALIADAWSTSVVFSEWATAYRDGVEALPPIGVRFRDYVLAARALEDGPQFRDSLDYWLDRVPTLPPAPELPLAVAPDAIERPEFTHRSGGLTAAEWARFKEYAAAAGVTPSAALCNAYAQVLAGWSKSSRFTLNVLFFNRVPLHPDVSKVVGNFTSTTLLEVDATATDSFEARVDRLQKQLWSDLEHSHVSGVRVLRELHRARGGAHPVTFPVVFASTVNFGARENPGAATGLTHPIMQMGEDGVERWTSVRTPQVWLDHQVIEEAGGVVLNWDSVDALFPPGLIDAMFAAYLGLVRELAADDVAWRRPAAVLTPETDLEVQRLANDTAGPRPVGLLQDGFLEQVRTAPGRTAVITAGREFTYGELGELANRLANWLRAQGAGAGAGRLVGVVMEKGWEQVAAVLGTLQAGAAYVPIDAGVPAERLRLLIESAGIDCVLTQSWVEAEARWPDGVTVLAVDGARVADFPAEAPSPATAPDDLAYVIFTSGSTGLPKGVMIEHAAALNTIADINERYAVTGDDRVLALSALNFDLSVYDIFGLLAVGGAIVLPEPSAHREPARWAELVTTHRVTIWNSVPTLMQMFTEFAAGSGADWPLRVVMMSGDWIPVTLPERIRELLPEAQVWSLGGATEAAIWSILYPIDEVDPSWTSVPYGKPMRNQRFHVLNEAMQPCPTLVAGQLYIAGAGLARGYLNDESKTRASFRRHPATGERLYRTGDLGRYLPSGDIEFLGREDFQVKVQGYRIELGEIEAALLRLPEVAAAAVTAAGERENKRLIGYVVPAGAGLDEEHLQAVLRESLPGYMVPPRILVLDDLPLSANGKVDRSALPAPDEAGFEGQVVAPADDLEACLAEIWRGFFDVPEISVLAGFFDLGGNSLLAVRMMAQVRSRLGRRLPLSALFAHPTIRDLARVLRETEGDAERIALVPIRQGGARTPLFLIHPVGGDVLCYADLARLLPDDQPLFGLQVPDVPSPLSSVPALAAHYADVVRQAVPEGPVHIGGWSMGGVLALEVAALLREAGRTVGLVAVIDLIEPPGPAAETVAEADLYAWLARDLAGLAGTDWTPDADLFETADPLGTLLTAGRAAGVLEDDVDRDALGQIADRFRRNSRALIEHSPRPYDGPVLFLRAAGGATVETAGRWLDLCSPGSTLTDLPGDHYSVMQTPHLEVLATHLCPALTRG